MDALAKEYADEAHHLFVYTRETHPEIAKRQNLPYLKLNSYEEKVERAQTMRDKWDTPRKILIDTLDGHVHRLHAGMPNMSWVIDHTVHILFKAGWTREADVRKQLEMALKMRDMKREGAVIQYYTERITYRTAGDRGQMPVGQPGAETAAG